MKGTQAIPTDLEDSHYTNPSPLPHHDCSENAASYGHLVSSEFQQVDNENCSSCYESSSPVANLQGFVDSCSGSQTSPASLDSHFEAKQSTQLASQAKQTDSLDKSKLDLNTRLIDMVCNDNAQGLTHLLRKMVRDSHVEKAENSESKFEDPDAILGYWFPHRLLQLACQMDAANCARALLDGETRMRSPVNAVDEEGKTALHYAASHLSTRCIEVLLHKHAKTDLCSKDGCTPIKSALQNRRWQTHLHTLPAIQMIRFLKSQDLTAVKLLAGHTKDVLRLACHLALDGNAAALSVLILGAGNSILGQEHRYESFLELIVEKTLSCRKGDLEKEVTETPVQLCNKNVDGSLKCLEIIVHLKGELTSFQKQDAERKKSSALLKAVQAGDEVVVKILLEDTTSVNETDPDGNTAIHWCLKASLTAEGLRILWQLIMHGAAIDARNRLGLTPVHIAAGRGNLQALQLLLAHNPDAVHIAAETQETPLFLAVKNNHVDCAKLLLRLGSKSQALNLRRQRPIDFASSQQMRTILTQDGRHSITGRLNESNNRKFLIGQSGLQTLDHEQIDSQIDKFIQTQDDLDDSYWLQRMQNAKTAMCRYHVLPGGCARGDRCFYAHAEHELRPLAQGKVKVMDVSNLKKIFVGGLSPAVDSEDLKEHFEAEFGPVEDATVMCNQTGQSRGFGFVTFKKKASFLAAVRQHYLTIYSKRVEIKAAIQPSAKMDEETFTVCLSAPPELIQDNFKNGKSMLKGGIAATIRDGTTAMVNTATTATSKAETAAMSFPIKRGPRWLEVFKKWLPAFLSEVSKRQHGGEFYPLSSIKADFRATCGMELDHVGLGFPKLSDFLRTIPELCRMKIVPVGRGPATHVILQAPKKGIAPKPGSRIVSSSLVHEGRTYAAAAGNKIADIQGAEKTPESLNRMPSRVEEDVLLDTLSITAPDWDSYVVEESLKSEVPQTASAASHAKDSTTHRYTGWQQANIISENLPVFPTSNAEEQQQQSYLKLQEEKAFPAWQVENVQRQLQHTFCTNAYFQSMMPETPETQPQQKNSQIFTPLYEDPHIEQRVHFPPFADRAMLRAQSNQVPYYNPWTSNPLDGCRNLIQQMNMAAAGEESPQSTLTSEDSVESSRQSPDNSPITCVICGSRQAAWAKFPCAHRSLCSPCKLFGKPPINAPFATGGEANGQLNASNRVSESRQIC